MPAYRPAPLDTTAVALTPSLQALLERLAANTHDVWAAARVAGGWRFGPARDDASKLHPCLVPYDELPDSEKEFDRRTAEETLKAILVLGYVIREPDLDEEPRRP